MELCAGHLDTLLRSLVLGRLASYGDQEVVKESKLRFMQHVNNSTPVPADLRSVVYRSVLRNGDEQTYNTMLKVWLIIFKHNSLIVVAKLIFEVVLFNCLLSWKMWFVCYQQQLLLGFWNAISLLCVAQPKCTCTYYLWIRYIKYVP